MAKKLKTNKYHPNIDEEIYGKVNKALKPVDRSKANVEAEKGETVITHLFGSGIPEHYVIGGEKHEKGGTPLRLPENSFIFSDDPSLKITDEKVLAEFDEKKPKTPAEIAKKYDLNKYKAILLNEDSTPIQKKTASIALNNLFDKLSKLALYQEKMKGYPDGVPEITYQYLMKQGIDPMEIEAKAEQKRLLEKAKNILRKGDTGFKKEEEKKMFGGLVGRESHNFLPEAELGMSISSPYQRDFLTYIENATGQGGTNNEIKYPTRKDFYVNNQDPGRAIKPDEYKDKFKALNPNATDKDAEKAWKEYRDKINEDYYKGFNLSIPLTPTIAGLDLRHSLANQLEQADRDRQMSNYLYSDAATKLGSMEATDRGDYVRAGSQYGNFRPEDTLLRQGYAASPYSQYLGNPMFQMKKGGSLSYMEGGGEQKTQGTNPEEQLKNGLINIYTNLLGEGKTDLINELVNDRIYYFNKLRETIPSDENKSISDEDIANYILSKEAVVNAALMDTYKDYIKGIEDKEDYYGYRGGEDLNNKLKPLNNKSKRGEVKELINKAKTWLPDETKDNHFMKLYEDEDIKPDNKVKYLQSIDLQLINNTDEHGLLPIIDKNKFSNKDGKFGSQTVLQGFRPKPEEDTTTNQQEDQLDDSPSVFDHYVPPGSPPASGNTQSSRQPSTSNNTSAQQPQDNNQAKEDNAKTEDKTKTEDSAKKEAEDKAKAKYEFAKKKLQDSEGKWWAQDVNNLLGAYMNYASIRKYYPTLPSYDQTVPTPTYYDPQRQLAEAQSSFAQVIRQYAASLPSNIGAAMIAATSGQGAQQAANIVAQTQAQNVGIANQYEGQRAAAFNKIQDQQYEAWQQYSDKLTRLAQNYDNSKRQALIGIGMVYNQGLTNAAYADMLNKMNIDSPFKVMPETGGFIGVNEELLKQWYDKSAKAPKTLPEEIKEFIKPLQEAGLKDDQIKDLTNEFIKERVKQNQSTQNQLPFGPPYIPYPSYYMGNYPGIYPGSPIYYQFMQQNENKEKGGIVSNNSENNQDNDRSILLKKARYLLSINK